MNFARQVELFINNHKLIAKDDIVIVGLSGGADSIALLTVLHELNYNVVATHCNFHLRGEESMRDELFCRDFCSEKGVDLIVRDFDVDSRRKETGESIEMACRALRYDWWKSLLDAQTATKVAVGHHREDNIETFFLNLLRGSSLVGLKGMLPRNGDVIRPLLNCRKVEILAYLQDQGQTYVTDSTNADNAYKRNRIRNRFVPLLEEEFPGSMDSIAQTIAHLGDNYSLYESYRCELKKRYAKADGRIDLRALVETEKDPRMALYEILSDAGVNMSQVENIICSFKGDGRGATAAGKIYRCKNLVYLLDRGCLIPFDEDSGSVQSERTIDLTQHPFGFRILSAAEFSEMKNCGRLNADALYADHTIMDDAVFKMRGWREGDRMRPFGLKGSKLLSDIFSNAKMSLNEKKNARVIERNSEIIWIPGVRCSALFPVTGKSEKVVEITYVPSGK